MLSNHSFIDAPANTPPITGHACFTFDTSGIPPYTPSPEKQETHAMLIQLIQVLKALS
ncbi:MAG: hypothetical protein KKG10_14960 [Proteobacteria bacterium]|nr:hypothetical protein [Pseudomonadota bacterium]